jgi:hypothetical protein
MGGLRRPLAVDGWLLGNVPVACALVLRSSNACKNGLRITAHGQRKP